MEILNYGIGGPEPRRHRLRGSHAERDRQAAAAARQRRRARAATTSRHDRRQDPYELVAERAVRSRARGCSATPIPGTTNLTLGGVMHYVAIDVANLSQWFQGDGAVRRAGNTAPARSRTTAASRSTSRIAATTATRPSAEDRRVRLGRLRQPGVANGAPNAMLDCGEDVNVASAVAGRRRWWTGAAVLVPATYVPVLDTYGGIPNYTTPSRRVPTVPPAPPSGQPAHQRRAPTTALTRGQAQVNRAILFRRALKLINGERLSRRRITGLTVVSENPVYIQGNWNARHHLRVSTIPTRRRRSSPTRSRVLSERLERQQLAQVPVRRQQPGLATADSYYRVAIISGKGCDLPQAERRAAASTFGTDGGAHSFLRMLEGGANHDGPLPRIDGDLLLQPAGGRHVQVLRRHRLQRAGHAISSSTSTSWIRRSCRRTRRCSAT